MNSCEKETTNLTTTYKIDTIKPTSESPIDVFYLSGVSYCGSTLMSFLLNTHPKILSIGEMGPMPAFENEEYRCSCGKKLKECPFILAVKDLMENKYGVSFEIDHWDLRHEYAVGPFAKRLMTDSIDNTFFRLVGNFIKPLFSKYRKIIQHYAYRNAAFMRAALEVSGKQVFFDANKSFLRIQLLKNNQFSNLKILHLVRDPRGYTYSALKHGQKPVHIAAQDWVKQNKYIDNNLRRLDQSQWVRLRYEALCYDPTKTLAHLASFVGVESSAVLTDGFGEKEHHIFGNNMRLRSSSLKSVKLDEKWRHTLSDEDLKIVRSIAGEHARKYGYDI